MRHNIAGRKFDRPSGERRALYRSLVTELLKHEKIVTTEPKAKEIRGMAEKMITLGKKGGLPAFRQALTFIFEEDVAKKVFAELAKRYANRPGGYTRIVKIGPRQGDGASMVQISLVE